MAKSTRQIIMSNIQIIGLMLFHFVLAEAKHETLADNFGRQLDENDNQKGDGNSNDGNNSNSSENGPNPLFFIILFSSVIVIFCLACLIFRCIRKRNRNIEQTTNGAQSSINLQKYDLQKTWPSYLDTQKACSICLGLKCNIITNCKHSYHSECLAQWIRKRKVCPACITTEFNPVASYCSKCSRNPMLKIIYKISHHQYSTIKTKCTDCEMIELSEQVIEQNQ